MSFLSLLATITLLVSSSVIKVSGSYEEEHEECYCPKPKTVTKYVVVETPKYVPVYKTKYVTIKEGYSKYEHDDSEYDKKRRKKKRK